ncbi:hypothetical protein CKJ89_38610, partial [Klebsiella pneumoniae]
AAEHVQPLFSTDFARERWVIQEGNSEIEIALDRWPKGTSGRAAEHVQPLFSTDFARERWVIQEGNSEIEIALDR